MKTNLGIVGLPNVGKSTVFNALVQTAKAEVANYPFCTINPNIGVVNVPDERLLKIAEGERSQKITPTVIEFVDIAGLVRGASKGEGLGNQFLGYIRQVSAIAQVIRGFENKDIVHVEGEVDPLRDSEIVEIELILADLQTIEKRLQKTLKISKTDKKARKELETLEKAKTILEDLKLLRKFLTDFSPEERHFLERELFLLTVKPMMYVLNIGEEDLPEPEKNPKFKKIKEKAEEELIPLVFVCGKVEQEVLNLPEKERREYLELVGIKESALNQVLKIGYTLLDLITFFTANLREARAWAVKRGTRAKEAAREIHSDMERGFIAAEVINFEKYSLIGSFQKARELGAVRIEGKDYLVEDGDIVLFKFNV